MHHNIIVIQVLERVDNVTHLPASDLHTHHLTARGVQCNLYNPTSEFSDIL